MRNLLLGLIDFRLRLQPKLKNLFLTIAESHKPDCLFVACSDSRVVPNLFASTNPGEMFVIRNVGNLVPCCSHHTEAHNNINPSDMEVSTGAAIEHSVINLKIKDIIICGHSNCGAMKALLGEVTNLDKTPQLASWIKRAKPSLDRYRDGKDGLLGLKNLEIDSTLPPVDQLSQINVLQQV